MTKGTPSVFTTLLLFTAYSRVLSTNSSTSALNNTTSVSTNSTTMSVRGNGTNFQVQMCADISYCNYRGTCFNTSMGNLYCACGRYHYGVRCETELKSFLKPLLYILAAVATFLTAIVTIFFIMQCRRKDRTDALPFSEELEKYTLEGLRATGNWNRGLNIN